MPEQIPNQPSPQEEKDKPLFERLKCLAYDKVRATLDRANLDPTAGIVVAKLDEPLFEHEGQRYALYAARVLQKTESGKQPFVTPHFHRKGAEPYFFLADTKGGEMNFGELNEDETEVHLKPSFSVSKGTSVVIREKEVHSFRNTGETAYDFVFACPDSHLMDWSKEKPDGDRFIVNNLKNGVPPHYEIKS